MSEPVVETPAATPVEAMPSRVPALRREAILPRERRGGLGAVALLCSLAGVASGFALATTILATQLASSEARMTRRQAHAMREHAFLGVSAEPAGDNSAHIIAVHPRSPAAEIGLRPGDRITSVDGERIDRPYELSPVIQRLPIGHEATLEVRRGTTTMVLHPTLIGTRSRGQ
jgi:S1-C subfamily serine protease